MAATLLASLLAIVVLSPAVAADPAVPATSPAAAGPESIPAAEPNVQPLDPASAEVVGDAADLEPSIQYEEWLAHAGRPIAFEPGGRVTIAFEPRADEHWPVDGRAPRGLPAGRATGDEMAHSVQGSRWAPLGDPAAAEDPTPTEDPAPTGEDPTRSITNEPSPAPDASAAPADASAPPEASPAPTPAPTPAPAHSPAPSPAGPVAAGEPSTDADPLAPAALSGMRRQVFGFLPYWELGDVGSTINYNVVSTIAYFSVGVDRSGNLLKRNADGSLTTGWSGWTSAKLTSIINAAHQKRTRVVLTVSAFAWTTSQTNTQKALLGSSTARLTLARQAAAAVRDRGADGINLDFEPLVAGYEDEFVALLRTVRTELNRVAAGYQLTYDTLGRIGNYPIEASVAAGAADAIFVMGYDYRTSSANYAGSIDPLAGPAYDLTDTVRAYTARVPGSKVILGMPWYGRAWSTVSDSVNARTQPAAQYGASAAVIYDSAVALAAQHGRRWDSRELGPWFAYRREHCTTTYGCVTTWRQVYYDDAVSLKLRYDVVNRYGLRGAGIWALGYNGDRPEMYRALADTFLNDTSPPDAGVRMLPTKAADEGFIVSWTAADDSSITTYDVQVSVAGGPWTTWITGTRATSDVYLGVNGQGYAFRARAQDSKGNVSAWNVASVWGSSTTLTRGNFGRVAIDGLAYRAGPGTAAQQLGTVDTGTVVAVTGGPVSADGYTWIEVTQPIREWGAVSFAERGVWMAVGSGSTDYITPVRAPNTTTVGAGLTGFGFGPGSLGTSAAARAARAFSPNGDGSEDVLTVRWSNSVAMDTLRADIRTTTGALIGSRTIGTLAAGPHSWSWDGMVDGVRVADGTYLVQLVGTVGASVYSAPSARPATASQVARYAVSIDTVAPTLTSATASLRYLSPDGDAYRDAVDFQLAGSNGASQRRVVIAPLVGGVPGSPVRTITGAGSAGTLTWNGRDDAGNLVPDGTYRATLSVLDVAGNAASKPFPLTVDTRSPAVTVTHPASFSPNGDGAGDTLPIRFQSDERGSGTITVSRGTTVYRTWGISNAATGSVTWNGRTAAGSSVPEGRVRVQVRLRDWAGNVTLRTTYVTLDRTLSTLRWSAGAFHPQDGDALVPSSRVTFRLSRAATVSLRIVDAGGTTIRTVWSGRAFGAGTPGWTWNGRTDAGAYAPPGRYTAIVTAVSALGTSELRRTVTADAFLVASPPASLRIGQTITLRFRTVEPLGTRPVVTFTQPGRTAVTRTATRLADGSYSVSITVASGAAGTATIRISATDTAGGRNTTTLAAAVGP